MELLKKIGAQINKFSNEVVRSAYDLAWYREVRRSHKLGDSIRYLLKLQVIIVLFYGAFGAAFLLPLPNVLSNQVAESVPDDAFFEVKDGKFDTNLPDDWEVRDGSDFVLDADPNHEGIKPPEVAANAWVFLGRDAIFARDDKGIRTVLYKDLEDFRFTKDELIGWIDEKLLGIILMFGLLGMLVGYAATLLMYSAFVGLGSLMAFGVSRLMKLEIPLERWLVLGFRMLTLSILVTTFLWILGVSVPYAFSLVYLMLALGIMFDERNNPLAAESGVAQGGESGPADSGKADNGHGDAS